MTLDRLKELLAAEKTKCEGKAPCPSCDAHMKLESLSRPLAEELVKSQEALKRCKTHLSEEGFGRSRAVTSACAALRMDGLEAK